MTTGGKAIDFEKLGSVLRRLDGLRATDELSHELSQKLESEGLEACGGLNDRWEAVATGGLTEEKLSVIRQSRLRVFVSHAVADRELAVKFVELLNLGAGVPEKDVFFSSQFGTIPNGAFFVQRILKELNRADLVIAVLSRAYFKSKFCLAEAGAALARQLKGDSLFYSLVVPPQRLSGLGGVLYGLQTGQVTEPQALSELRNRIASMHVDCPSTSVWDEKRAYFLKATKEVIERHQSHELLPLISVESLQIERTDAPAITYKSKLRVTLRNGTDKDLDVGPATWNAPAADSGVRLHLPSVSPLIWQLDHIQGKEVSVLRVPSGALFRTWIGLHVSVSDNDVLARQIKKQLGLLVLPIKVEGHDIIKKIEL